MYKKLTLETLWVLETFRHIRDKNKLESLETKKALEILAINSTM